MLQVLQMVDEKLATAVAANLGLAIGAKPKQLNYSVPADGNPKDFEPVVKEPKIKSSAALSMANTIKDSIKTRKVAFLVADGVDASDFSMMKKALEAEGAVVELIAPKLGAIKIGKDEMDADESLLTAASVFYDAVFVPGGEKSIQMLSQQDEAIHFINQAYKHCKAIALAGDAAQLLSASYLPKQEKEAKTKDEALLVGNVKDITQNFIKAIAKHRNWEREKNRKVPA